MQLGDYNGKSVILIWTSSEPFFFSPDSEYPLIRISSICAHPPFHWTVRPLVLQDGSRSLLCYQPSLCSWWIIAETKETWRSSCSNISATLPQKNCVRVALPIIVNYLSGCPKKYALVNETWIWIARGEILPIHIQVKFLLSPSKVKILLEREWVKFYLEDSKVKIYGHP